MGNGKPSKTLPSRFSRWENLGFLIASTGPGEFVWKENSTRNHPELVPIDTNAFKVFLGTTAWKWLKSAMLKVILDCLWRFMRIPQYPSMQDRRQNRLSICGSKCLWGEGTDGNVRGGYIIYYISIVSTGSDQLKMDITMDIFRCVWIYWDYWGTAGVIALLALRSEIF